MPADINPPKAVWVCPKHGGVRGDFFVGVTGQPYSTGPICPKCYVDWVKAHVNAVHPETIDTIP